MKNLTEIPLGKKFLIKTLTIQNPKELGALLEYGLLPGREILLQARYPSADKLIVRLDELVLGMRFSTGKQVMVEGEFS